MDMLKREELVRLILAVREGDDEAFDLLVEHYTPLIHSVIRKFSRSVGEYFSEACMAFYKAVQTYKVEQGGVTFGLYATILITRAVGDLYRKDENAVARISDLDVEDIAVSDGIVSRLMREEESEELRDEARSLLSDFEYHVFLLWLGGYKTAEIARILKKGSRSVDNAKGRILKKLRDGLSPRHR